MIRRGETKKQCPLHHLTQVQLAKLMTAVQAKADEARRKGNTRAIIDELLVQLLVDAGLKPKELCALDIKDILPGQKIIHIQDRHFKRNRDIAISEQTASILKRFIQLYRADADASDPLLLGERGARFTYISLYSKIRRIGHIVNIKNLTPNLLRQTYMVHLYQKEQDLKLVQNQAGHASHKTTAHFVLPKTTTSKQTCDACEASVSVNSTTQIDSGQILCARCLRALRRQAKQNR